MLISYDRLPDDALVFIYQADTNVPFDTCEAINHKINTFIEGWTSHQIPVNGFGKVYYNRFLIFFADETGHSVSGCSKDKVTQFIREIGEQYHIDFFNRMHVAYKDDTDQVLIVSLKELSSHLDAGKIKPETIVFNNLVATKMDWEKFWKQPLSSSPFSRYIIQKAD